MLLLLQRAAETVSGDDECNDPAVLLACALGSTGCPAKCANKKSEEDRTPSNISDMPIAGDLTIAVADYSDAIRSVPKKGTVVFNAVDFKASEKITIESVKLERTGLSDKSAIKWVWFEKDGVAVSAKASLSSDGTVTTRFYNNFSVNGTETLDVLVELDGDAGNEIAFNFVGVTSTAKNVSVNTKTSTYRTTEYTVATVKFDVNGNNAVATEYKVGDSKTFEIGKFKLINDRPNGVSEDRDVVLKSLKLKNEWDLDLGESLKNVYVTRDGKTVSKKVELNNKDMIIYFDNEEIVSGKTNLYTIFTEVAQLNETNRNVKLKLNKASELVANEKSANFRTNVTVLNPLKSYVFKWGKVTFTNDASLSKTIDAAAGSTDVVLGKGTLTVSEPIKLGYITLKTTEDLTPTTTSDSAIIKDLKIEIGGSTYYTTPTCVLGTKKCEYKTNDEDIYVSKTAEIRVLANVKGGVAELNKVKFDAVLNWASIEKGGAGTLTDPYYAWLYDNSNEDKVLQSEIAGSIQLSTLNVKAGKFNITNRVSSTRKVAKNDVTEVSIFSGEISAKDGTISVNELVVAGTFDDWARAAGGNGLLSTEAIDLTLYVNWEAFSTQTLRGTTETSKTFSSLGDVKAGTPMKIEIMAQPNVSAVGSITFAVSANGSDANGNSVVATQVNASKLEITAGAELSVWSTTASSSVIKDWSEAEILSFWTTVKNSSLDLGKVVVNLNDTTNPALEWKTIYLRIDWSNEANHVYKTATDSNKITFAGLNQSLKAGDHTFEIKAGLTENATPFKINTVELYDVDDNLKGTVKANATKLVLEAFPVLSATTRWEDLILTISNPKDSDESIEIVGFKVTWKVKTASLNDKVIADPTALATLAAANQETVGIGKSIELDLQADAWETVQVTAITFKVKGNTYTVDSTYTNIGKWTSFKVTSSKDAPTVVGVTSVTLNKASTSIVKWNNETLTATVAPSNASNKALTWASSDTSIATVDANGKVTAVAAGTANITATADNITSTPCVVTVTNS